MASYVIGGIDGKDISVDPSNLNSIKNAYNQVKASATKISPTNLQNLLDIVLEASNYYRAVQEGDPDGASHALGLIKDVAPNRQYYGEYFVKTNPNLGQAAQNHSASIFNGFASNKNWPGANVGSIVTPTEAGQRKAVTDALTQMQNAVKSGNRSQYDAAHTAYTNAKNNFNGDTSWLNQQTNTFNSLNNQFSQGATPSSNSGVITTQGNINTGSGSARYQGNTQPAGANTNASLNPKAVNTPAGANTNTSINPAAIKTNQQAGSLTNTANTAAKTTSAQPNTPATVSGGNSGIANIAANPAVQYTQQAAAKPTNLTSGKPTNTTPQGTNVNTAGTQVGTTATPVQSTTNQNLGKNAATTSSTLPAAALPTNVPKATTTAPTAAQKAPTATTAAGLTGAGTNMPGVNVGGKGSSDTKTTSQQATSASTSGTTSGATTQQEQQMATVGKESFLLNMPDFQRLLTGALTEATKNGAVPYQFATLGQDGVAALGQLMAPRDQTELQGAYQQFQQLSQQYQQAGNSPVQANQISAAALGQPGSIIPSTLQAAQTGMPGSYTPGVIQSAQQGAPERYTPGVIQAAQQGTPQEYTPTGYTAAQVSTPNALTAAQQSSQGQTVTADYANTALTQAQNVSAGDVNAMASQLYDSALVQQQKQQLRSDIQRQLNNQLSSLNVQELASGNLSSSRAGVAEGITRRGASESLAKGTAEIENAARTQAYQQAQSITQTNQGLQYNAATQNAANLNAINQFNISNNLASQQFNANTNVAREQFNVGQQNTMAQYNAQANQAAQQFNVNQLTAAAQFNQTASQQAAFQNIANLTNQQQYNTTAQNQIAQYNQTTASQAAFQNIANLTNQQQYNANVQNQTAQFNQTQQTQAALQNIANQMATQQYNVGQQNAMTQLAAQQSLAAQTQNAQNQMTVNQQNVQNSMAAATANQNANLQAAQLNKQQQLAALQGSGNANQMAASMAQYISNMGQQDAQTRFNAALQLQTQQQNQNDVARQNQLLQSSPLLTALQNYGPYLNAFASYGTVQQSTGAGTTTGTDITNTAGQSLTQANTQNLVQGPSLSDAAKVAALSGGIQALQGGAMSNVLNTLGSNILQPVATGISAGVSGLSSAVGKGLSLLGNGASSLWDSVSGAFS